MGRARGPIFLFANVQQHSGSLRQLDKSAYTRATSATSYLKDSGALIIESHEPSDPEPFFASRQRELWVNKKLDVFLKFDAISEQSEWAKQIERIGSTFV